MKVLVTGGTGFIGSHLVAYLVKKKYDVFCLIRKSSSLDWLRKLPVKYIYGDLSSKSLLTAAFKKAGDGFDYIYHLAGVTKAGKKELYYRENFLGSRNLIEVVARDYRQRLKKFLAVSSLAAVGPAVNGRAVTEESECRPIADYGLSKLQGERAILKYSADLPITIIRPPVVYGPRDRDLFVYFRTINAGVKPIVGPRKYFSIIYVSDLVAGINQAAESEKAVGRIYFMANQKYYSFEDIGRLVQQALGRKVITLKLTDGLVGFLAACSEGLSRIQGKTTIFNRQKAREMAQRFWICDTSRARSELNFMTRVSLTEGVKQTADWYRSHDWLKN
ncbi:MAG: NAD-dependent epimerase/dehydratase family protein [Planctomycetes bacterium]|nr:NAD-dependent epimerase/dehydratase family protein [Planctomycetota bacterium]